MSNTEHTPNYVHLPVVIKHTGTNTRKYNSPRHDSNPFINLSILPFELRALKALSSQSVFLVFTFFAFNFFFCSLLSLLSRPYMYKRKRRTYFLMGNIPSFRHQTEDY